MARMANLIAALLAVQGVVSVVLELEVDQQALVQGLGLKTDDDYTMFANDVKSKTTAEEQAVLKTLLDKRVHWHPEAESLFNDVLKRPSSRRLKALGGGDDCDGDTEALCTSMVDEQCQACKWDSAQSAGYQCSTNSCSRQTTAALCASSLDTQLQPCKWSSRRRWGGGCDVNKCSDHTNQTDCCANAKQVATGCFWNAAASKCYPRTCDEAGNFGDGSSYSSADSTARKAARIQSCNDQPACTLVCAAEEAGDSTSSSVGNCESGVAADWECETITSTWFKSKRTQTVSVTVTSGACNIIDCSTCLKSEKHCGEKKTKVKDTSENGCADKCSSLAPDDATVECVFCGPKAAGCTPKPAIPPPPSCTTITETTTPAPPRSCSANCQAAEATCSTMGVCRGSGGLVAGAAGLTATIVGVLALVGASVVV